MNENTLLLFTNDYPYGKKETYLETEINYASKKFDNIIIVTTTKQQYKRNVPSNVKVFNVKRNYRLLSCFLYSFFKCFSRENINEFRSFRKKYGFVKTFIGIFKCQMIAKRYELFVHKLKLDYSHTIGYSYWLNNLAYSLVRINIKKKMIKIVSRVHGFELRDDEVYIPFRQKIEDGLTHIFFISNNGLNKYNEIMKTYKICENKNCKKIMSRLGTTRSTNIENHSTNPNNFVIVSCSLVYPLKRLDLIIDILSSVQCQETKIKWIHFGGGPDLDTIKKLAKEKLPNIDVTFCGQISNKEINDFYCNNRVDLFINMSDSEGIPVSIMEAESYGIPILARNVGGLSEIVNNEIGHLVISDNIVGESKEYILSLLGTSKVIEYISDLRNAVIKYWNENYNAERNYRDFYIELTREN